jgi:hydroxymethylbilane synthase
VHSAKDLPASDALVVPGLVVAAFPERADPRDVLVGGTLHDLPTGSVVATGSARRRVQLANRRADLSFADLRGNLASRLAQCGVGGVSAVVVAKAALDRLEWEPPEGTEIEVLDPEIMLPQVAQGALAVECRADDATTRAALAALDDHDLRPLLLAERAFLSELGGGCTMPVGAHAVWDRSGPTPTIRLTGMLAGADGQIVLRHEQQGEDVVQLGRGVARYLLDDAGGSDLGDWSPSSGRGAEDASSPVVA